MTANCLISRAETWPGKSVHGSVGLSLEVFTALESNEQP